MGLSLPSREAVMHIAIREATGYSLDEIAVTLDRQRPEHWGFPRM